MHESTPEDVARLLAVLRERFDDSLRSCVEYMPTSRTIHYLREDIDESVARSRLVRIDGLYQSERLSTGALRADGDSNPLHASIHLFGGVTVVHLVDPGGRVVGFSLDGEALPDARSHVDEYLESVFGDAH